MKGKRSIIVIISILLLSTVSVSIAGSQPVVELPPTTHYVTMRATDGINSWFDMEIKDIPFDCDIANGTYLGWCAQKDIEMTRGVNHTVRLYSSYDPNMPISYDGAVNWSKINYILNHKQGNRDSIQKAIWHYIHLDNYSSNPDAQAMIADADQNGSDFIPKTGEVLAIIVEGTETIQRSFFEYVISEPHSYVNWGNAKNHAPTADATAGEPYTGFTREEITFDGSRSYDRDGIVAIWKWDFGDGTTGTGEIVKHSYAEPGNYTVTLTVYDNKGSTDTYTTTVVIALGNNPPNTPTISGPVSGFKNTLYEFTVVSTDVDNDSLQYIFDWSDGEVVKTVYYSSGTPIIRNHTWSKPGHYAIAVKASDSNISSGNATLTILIDVLDVDDLGYLIEYDNDGTYDAFHSNSTGNETEVKKLDNGNYLIDSNGDGTWDYEYNPASGKSSVYQEPPIAEYMVFIILLIVAFLILFFILRRKRRA